MLKYFIGAFCSFSTLLLANSHPAPGEWEVEGEYLFLKPAVDDTYFVIDTPSTVEIDSPTVLIGNEKNNNLDFNSGYRVGIAYTFCDCETEMALKYTQFNADHKRTIAGEYLSPTIGIEDFTYEMADYTGFAHSKVGVQYQRADGLFAQKMCECKGLDFRVVFGVEFADLNVHQHIQYVPNSLVDSRYTSRVNQKSNTWGVGPEIGIDYNFALGQCFDCMPDGLSFNVYSTGSLLIAESKSKVHFHYSSSTTTYPYEVSQEKSTRVIPAFHMGAALNYDLCMWDWDTSIGIGYEFNTYLNSLLKTTNIAYYGYGLTSSNYNNFSLQGLSVSLAIRF